MKNIELFIRELKNRRDIPTNELVDILKTMLIYIQSEEEIMDILVLFPKFREGINLLGSALFSSQDIVVRKALEILLKIQNLTVGKVIFQNSNANIQQAYYSKIASVLGIANC